MARLCLKNRKGRNENERKKMNDRQRDWNNFNSVQWRGMDWGDNKEVEKYKPKQIFKKITMITAMVITLNNHGVENPA